VIRKVGFTFELAFKKRKNAPFCGDIIIVVVVVVVAII
jgi:hypothetical protein